MLSFLTTLTKLSWLSLSLASASFHLDIPLYLDVPPSFHFLSTKAQLLINTHLDSLNLTIPYKTTFLAHPHDNCYVIKLGYSAQESFFISPHGRSLTVFQTDALIVHSEVPLLIKDVVIRHLLSFEIDSWSMGYMSDGIGCTIDQKMNVSLQIATDMRYLNWEDELFHEVFTPVLNELQQLTYVEVALQIIKPELLDNTYVTGLKWGYDQLRFHMILTEEVELALSPDGESHSMIIPRQGALFTRRLSRPLTEMDQIELVEHFTALLFKVLGFPQSEPKSPFIRLDYMARKQLYKNYLGLSPEHREQLQVLIDQYEFGRALELSWDLLLLE